MKYEKIQAPKGVSEYAPPLSAAFEWVREQLISPAKLAGYQLIELRVVFYLQSIIEWRFQFLGFHFSCCYP